MKRLLTFLLALAAAAASAGPVNNMVAQCEAVMRQGACAVALDPRDYPNATILIAGVGRISTASYLRIRAPADARNPDGTFRMCAIVREVCTADWTGDDCKAARALWRQSTP